MKSAFGLLLWSAAAAAQQYGISTYAGGGPPLPAPAPGVDVPIGSPQRVATDAVGNVYFTSRSCLFKLDPSGLLTRVAGWGRPDSSGDGGPATSAGLAESVGALGVAADRAGNVFVADFGNGRIRRISPDGIIATVAGGGGAAGLGDGGPATSADLFGPIDVAVDDSGDLFVADFGHYRVRRVSPDGIITTAAGGGAAGLGDGGPAASAQVRPWAIAVDGAGNLFITDYDYRRIRRVSPSGIITTVAGGGTASPGDGGPATSAELRFPMGVAVDAAGNLFVAEFGQNRVRKVSPNGIITTVAGNGTPGFEGDGGPATRAQLAQPSGVAVDRAGNLFIADSSNQRIRKVSPDGIITTVAGDGTFRSFSGDGGLAASAQLGGPSGLTVDGEGNLFIADSGNARIRKVSQDGIITTVAGNGAFGFSGDGGPATRAQLNSPVAVAVDRERNLFIADSGNQRIRKVSPDGVITTVAGNGTPGFSGDGGPATSAQLNLNRTFDLIWCQRCGGVAVDGAGDLFIADVGNYRVRKVSPSGIITTVAGNGTIGSSGDDGPAASAQLGGPTGVAVDTAGNLFIADYDPSADGGRIRKVSSSGIITTVAGDGSYGSSGDGGPATSAALGYTSGVAVDAAGNLLITTFGDYFDHDFVRKVSPAGIITTIAAVRRPSGVAVDGAGSVYVTGSSVVHILRPTAKSVFINAVMDAASQRADPVSPGKIVVLYGRGLGPSRLIQNQPSNGQFGAELAGTAVSFNGIAAPILYTSATQVAAIAPYALSGTTAQVRVTYQGEVSADFTMPVAASAPSLFTANQSGAGHTAAINAADGVVNTAANPVRTGGFISLYATGEGQTTPAGVDGRIAGLNLGRPVLPVRVTVGGIPATVQYAGGAPGQVSGLMQVNVQIPNGVQPGGYVPVVLQVGDRSSGPAVWIAVSGN